MKTISNKIAIPTLLCSMCLTSHALADYDNYLRLDVGGVILQHAQANDMWPGIKKNGDGGVSYDIGYGYRFTENFRGDITIGRWDTMKTKGYDPVNSNKLYQKFSSTLMLVNAYIDWPVMDNISWYVSGGVGAAFNKSKSYVAEGGIKPFSQPGMTNENFAWSVGAGGTYDINETLNIDLQYRYYDAGKVVSQSVGTGSSGGSSAAPASSYRARGHVITLGLKYNY